MRRSPKVAEVLPILYLRGLATGDFRPALEALLGEDGAGLSPTTITRLTAGWEKEYTDFRQRDLGGREYVYVWVDGIHFNLRLDDDRLCTLVMIGVEPNVPAIFPSNVPAFRCFLPSTGSLGLVPPLPRYCEALRLPAAPPAPLRFLRFAVPPPRLGFRSRRRKALQLQARDC
jgi:Transposase, Mutator family